MEKEKEPFISIIIPVYNAAEYLPMTIKSVLEQTYRNWELLLIDDCSSDNSAEIIRPFLEANKVRYFCQEQNAGAAAARNRGLREAKGTYAAFLDADDIWKPEKLQHQISVMLQEKVDFSFTGYEFGDREANPTGRIVRVKNEISYRQALKNTTIFTSTVMLHIEGYDCEKFFMPQIKSEDTALWWRLLREQISCRGINENLVIYRRPGKSLSSNKLEAVRRIWNLYRRAEHLNVFYSSYLLMFWAVNAVLRRI